MKQLFLLLCLYLYATLINSLSFCSSYCQQLSCADSTPNSCTGCNSPFTYNASASPKCQIQSPSNWIIYATDTTGSTLTYSGSPTIFSCGGLSFYGLIPMTSTFNLNIPSISTPYWQLQIVFTAIIASTNSAPTNNIITTLGSNINQFSFGSLTVKYDACGTSTKQLFFQISNIYTMSTVGASLTYLISTDSTDTTINFGVRQFIILIRLCDPKCKVCVGDTSNNNCSACTTSGAYESFLISSNNSCVSTCPTEYIQDTTNHVCNPCLANCSQCQTTTSNCTSCLSTPSQYYLISSSNTCVLLANCPAGSYGQTSNSTCTSCNTNCTACSGSANNCSACVSTPTQYYFYSGSNFCLLPSDCPTQTYANSLTFTCSSCSSICTACFGTSTNCSACVTTPIQYFLISSTYTCVLSASCLTGTYPDVSTSVCVACNSSCLTCSGSSNNCLTCVTTPTQYYFYAGNNSCILPVNCPTGTFAQSSTFICQNCDSICSACFSSSTNCSACSTAPTHYFLISSTYTCVISTACPVGTYADASTSVCTVCNSNCSQCVNSATNCTICSSSPTQYYYLQASFQCLLPANCPVGTYTQPTNFTCSPCHANCSACSVNYNNCSSCIATFYLYNNFCYNPCPQSTYISGIICIACPSRCLTCNSSTYCSTCKTSGGNTGYLTSSNTCVNPCPSGLYGDNSNHTCCGCNSNCYTCANTAVDCTGCTGGLYLFPGNHTCIASCPTTNYYTNSTSFTCVACNNKCLVCLGPSTNCTSCTISGANQAYLFSSNNTCLTNCPNQYYKDISTHVCLSCDTSCFVCTANPSPCTTCSIGYSLYQNTCIIICPAFYYSAPDPYYNGSFICTPCDPSCQQCFGTTNETCTLCQFNLPHWLSNTTCGQNCSVGFGYSDYIGICVQCDPLCQICYNDGSNCSSCKVDNMSIPLAYVLIGNGTSGCVVTCPTGYYANNTNNTCLLCNSSCITCKYNANYCLTCQSDLFILNNKCYNPCPFTYYQNGIYCSKCNSKCLVCTGNPTNCSECNTTIPAFYLSNKCYINCPIQNYNSIPDNYTCQPCDTSCYNCTGDPGPCSQCTVDYYMYQYQCYLTCPSLQLFEDNITMRCLTCDQYCIRLDLIGYFQTSVQDTIIFDLQFSEPVDFSLLDLNTFTTISFSDPFFTLSMFSVTTKILSNTTYQVIVKPLKYLFVQNVTVILQTKVLPANKSLYDRAINGRPFHWSVYQQNARLLWFALIVPDMSDYQKQVIQSMSQLSDTLNYISTIPGVQQIKKTGIISLLAPGVQITSCVLLVNNILPRNLYQGIRLFASSIFFEVPPWQKPGNHTKYVFNTPIKQITKQNRLLSQRKLAVSNQWRFQRTGWSDVFTLDNYIQLLMIALCWVMLALCHFFIFKNDRYGKPMSRVYSIFHKIHQICILYLTVSTVLQFITYQNKGQLTFSLIICLIVMTYFLIYEVYMYYDMHKYPNAVIGSLTYRTLVCRYGCFLNKIRYQQYQYESTFSPKLWFRPYNYQLLSYYKKVLMMVSLPLFHNYQFLQILVLIAIQTLQIIRFVFTWPYAQKWRNIIKLLLQFSLLFVFVVVLVTNILSIQLMKNDPNSIQSQAKWFNLLGWIAFVLVVAFNLFSFLFVLYQMLCMKSSFEQVGKIRKQFYFEKLQEYEADNQILQKTLIKKWIQLGNLNDKEFVSDNKIPKISVKIQTLKVFKKGKFFSVAINKILTLRIKAQQQVYQNDDNRLIVTDKLKKNVQITQSKNQFLYQCFSKIYQKCSVQALYDEGFVLTTSLIIDTSQYKKGGNVFLHKSDMEQSIDILDKFNIKIKDRKFNLGNQLIQGFPLDPKQVRNL